MMARSAEHEEGASVMTTDGGGGRVGGSERERGGVGNFIRTLFLSNLART